LGQNFAQGTLMGFRLDDIARSARTSLETSIGLGVLVFQQAQVQRRELRRVGGQLLQELGTALDERLKLVEERVSDLNERNNGGK
jgi:hypothetical protein